MQTRQLLIIVLLWLTATLGLTGTAVNGEGTDANKEQVLARLRSFNNIIVRSRVSTKFMNGPAATAPASQPTGLRPAPDTVFEETTSTLGTMHKWVSIAGDDRTKQLMLRRTVIIGDSRCEVLNQRSTGTSVGLISNSVDAWDSLWELGIGLRFISRTMNERLLTGSDIANCTAGVNPDGKRWLKLVVPYEMHMWVFDPNHGNCMTSYAVDVNGHRTLEIIPDDFRTIGDLVLPYHVRFQRLRDENVVIEKDAVVEDITINSAENTPDKYHMHWPKGTTLLDNRTGAHLDVKEDGQAITDEMSAEAAATETNAKNDYVNSRRKAPTDDHSLQPKATALSGQGSTLDGFPSAVSGTEDNSANNRKWIWISVSGVFACVIVVAVIRKATKRAVG